MDTLQKSFPSILVICLLYCVWCACPLCVLCFLSDHISQPFSVVPEQCVPTKRTHCSDVLITGGYSLHLFLKKHGLKSGQVD